ncbi:hypothetical protein P2D89_24935 [Agrobacterium rhizogenes]|uniref:hypothetical protein n=1 Tax=Rhizobium rhizogenes TaxID=359 RepID=UPI002858FE34|nr:hypothetical protein [Rhizobium rhizogenes]MDF1892248.1 hypothetical protein [Rhizobium rhizogenes]
MITQTRLASRLECAANEQAFAETVQAIIGTDRDERPVDGYHRELRRRWDVLATAFPIGVRPGCSKIAILAPCDAGGRPRFREAHVDAKKSDAAEID